ncbi:MAG TPA: D-TA family PLP-dependent enzyme [Chitinophagaceae bacterium]|nr:D-TA family PLP-dependent enzyme [Chitinophagaceae bacterium]
MEGENRTDTLAWYLLNQPESTDTPALLVYPDRILRNIRLMISIAGNPHRLMPHVKTHKMEQVVAMQIEEGIFQFKCATIAEAEMLALAGARQVLLAYQLTATKALRWQQLIRQYPDVQFSSLVDNRESASMLSHIFAREEMTAEVYIDVDNGMHRTGHPSGEGLYQLYLDLLDSRHLYCRGLHVYDGHIRDPEFRVRRERVQEAFRPLAALAARLEAAGYPAPILIAGGTPSFTVHAMNPNVICSPGTCVLWDEGYHNLFKEQLFEYAAVLMMRVISRPQPGRITLDLGHKSVAAENPVDQRISLLDRKGYRVVSQSEEHLVVDLPEDDPVAPGDVIYGIPHHICPSVALYDEAQVVESGRITAQWPVVARRRRITI